jgi:hypothetical protein
MAEIRKAKTALDKAIKTPYSDDKHLGLITPRWHRNRMSLAVPMGHAMVEIYADGMEVGIARCVAVNEARRARLRYLFFLDWDVLPPQDVLYRLVYHLENNPELDVASGMYCLKSVPTYPMLWTNWDGGVSFDWTVGDVLDNVVGIPMGCCLIRMSVFDRLSHDKEKPWFKTIRDNMHVSPERTVPRECTEDIYFCKRLVEEIGGKIRVDTNCMCGHICHTTGREYHLGTDSLPMKRARQNGRVKDGSFLLKESAA